VGKDEEEKNNYTQNFKYAIANKAKYEKRI
jgi:hypothetical protein